MNNQIKTRKECDLAVIGGGGGGMIGTKKALAIGIRNDKIEKRFTYLKYLLNKERIYPKEAS